MEECMSILKNGDEVAILPNESAAPSEVLEIVKVSFAGSVITELADGRMFATGVGVGFNNNSFMTRVTEEHRAALNSQIRPWSAAELTMLGRYTDKEVAKMTGRPIGEIVAQREVLPAVKI